jgi:hypothetical protein
MLVQVFDAVAPPRTLLFENERQSLAAIVDGAGSWGMGREAADLCRDKLSRLWANVAEWCPAQLLRDVTETALGTPGDLRHPEFGWSFSVTALLCTDGVVACIAAGFYRVDVIGPGESRALFRPAMLVDDLLAKGTLTPETIAMCPHKDVCLGPWVGDDDKVTLTAASHLLAPGDVVLVTHAARPNAALAPGSRLPGSAAALAALGAPASYPSPVIFVRS